MLQVVNELDEGDFFAAGRGETHCAIGINQERGIIGGAVVIRAGSGEVFAVPDNVREQVSNFVLRRHRERWGRAGEARPRLAF